MNHSYEEIRAATLDILAGSETTTDEPHIHGNIEFGVAEVFLRREIGSHKALEEMRSGRKPRLSEQDAKLFMEVFWDLFRQGIITLGYNSSDREFPHCRVSRMGQRILENQGVYFFHDVTTYERFVLQEIPTIDKVTLLYLKEAMQAFRSGCIYQQQSCLALQQNILLSFC